MALQPIIENEIKRTSAGLLSPNVRSSLRGSSIFHLSKGLGAIKIESVRQKRATIPGIEDGLGQVHITFIPTAMCYKFTNAKGIKDLAWLRLLFGNPE